MKCEKFQTVMRSSVCLARQQEAKKFPACVGCPQGAEVAQGRADDEDVEKLQQELAANGKKVRVMDKNLRPAIPEMPIPACKNHPEAPSKIDKLGRPMGLCVACLSARGRRHGRINREAGKIAPPVAIPLNLPKYRELLEWLTEQAEENERSLHQEIMYRLKLARRLAGKGEIPPDPPLEKRGTANRKPPKGASAAVRRAYREAE
jgi:hypothetical protein